MRFQERQQIVIFCLAAVLLGGFALFRYLPLRKSIKAIERERTAQMLVIAKASAESKQLPEFKERLRKLQMAVGSYEQQVPAQRALGVFLHRIADLMNQHKLREQLVQPGEEIKADTLNCVPVMMRCKGRLNRIFEFYKSLQGLGRLVRIEQVKLENESDFSGEVSMQTKVSIYYRSQKIKS